MTTEIKLRAERRAGELLLEMEKHPGGNPNLFPRRNRLERLRDLGVSLKQSSDWPKQTQGRPAIENNGPSLREDRLTIPPKEAETRLNHLNKFFAGYRIAGITPSVITQYVERRQEEDAANATINRELATMSRLLRLATKMASSCGFR
jgi:hypothetical protein